MRSAAHLELVRDPTAVASSSSGLAGLDSSVLESVTTAATLAHERTLPVVEGLSGVVPAGALQRGSTVAVHGVGSTSFALALAGQAVNEGSFLAIVAPDSFGLASCLDFDIPLRRVVQFVLPQDLSNWGQAVAAIVEGFDVVVVADRRRVGSSQARQLVARNRERGSVLMRVGGPAWPDEADLRFDVGSPDWLGLGEGHGHLRARKVEVRVAGRRHHGRQRVHEIMLPADGGGVERAPKVTAAAERFAGADIDAMLDAIDQGSAGTASEGNTASAGDAGASGLDAIA